MGTHLHSCKHLDFYSPTFRVRLFDLPPCRYCFVLQHLVLHHRQIYLIIRLEKANKPELEWFRDTVKVGLPGIKDKLTLLHPMARHLSLHHNLDGVEKLSVESEEWQSGHRDFIRNGRLSSQAVIPSTYPNESSQPRRRLGMGSIRR